MVYEDSSEDHLKKQAKEDPESLFQEIENSEDPNYLTYAAEFIGHVNKDYRDKALELLERLLDKYNSDTDQEHFIVREGIISGLVALHWISSSEAQLSDSEEKIKEDVNLNLFLERIHQIITFYSYHSNEKSRAVRASAIQAMIYV